MTFERIAGMRSAPPSSRAIRGLIVVNVDGNRGEVNCRLRSR